MNATEMAGWVRYWGNSKRGVSIDQINSIEDLRIARKHCSVMRLGLFTNVSDARLFSAVIADRVDRATMSVRKAAAEIGGTIEDVNDLLRRHGKQAADI